MIISYFPIGTLETNEDLPEFDYTGTYSIVDDGDAGWRIRFLTGGTLTLNSDRVVDIFAVGGGGNGAAYGTVGGGGGGGGKTNMVTGIPLTAGTGYVVTVGGSRGTSKFADLLSASPGSSASSSTGGSGGSGGGAGYAVTSPYNGGNGGSNGSAGGNSSGNSKTPGSGQGTTTREFHETSGRLYAGGGGGGTRTSGTPGSGGSGGGGAGSLGSAAKNGSTNYGGGGGGNTSSGTAGSGGSGIVVIRNTRG